MSRGGGKNQGKDSKKRDIAGAAYSAGLELVRANPALRSMGLTHCRSETCELVPRDGLVTVDSEGKVHAHPDRLAEPGAWAWALAHASLHVGFGHVPAATGEREQPDRFDLAARCVVVNRFLLTFPIGVAPEHLPTSYPDGDEEQLAARWRRDGLPTAYERCGTADSEPDQILLTWPKWAGQPTDWQLAFAHALAGTMSAAMDMAGGRRDSLDGETVRKRPWEEALSWFISSYPLLGGIASGMKIIADADIAHAHGIAVAAVDATAGEIYINPLRDFEDEEWRFILAHEMLHAALRHGDRCGTRDPYLFNVAADYVINGWLCEMQVGTMPEGLLYDPELKGLSAEEVYDRIAGDLRRKRRLSTLRGKGTGDILSGPLGAPGDYVDLDEFYRRGLGRGLDLHQRQERGYLPGGLVEEIRALTHPPLPWDARLARWFDEFVPRPEPVRSYARPSRRQSATPDIPRAGRYFPPEEVARCTFGVVLDTSGSMNRVLLGKALGAIASYAEARDVPAARVVFCDTAPHDAGYLPVTEIAGRVRVHGRGGTVLQPGIDLLQRADDFPPGAPLLVITDGWCDALRVRREHAYLIPQGARLPFTARGPVFRVQ
ncbi:vWA domain-containing protein [Streptomyces neyagawaensis]|uniref:Putative metallopeptidase domain-containing protein n=1 Tax=Streptomyces neyagawaensis TaxID=42238 RepID=A0ABV3B5V1_9ACTN